MMYQSAICQPPIQLSSWQSESIYHSLLTSLANWPGWGDPWTMLTALPIPCVDVAPPRVFAIWCQRVPQRDHAIKRGERPTGMGRGWYVKIPKKSTANSSIWDGDGQPFTYRPSTCRTLPQGGLQPWSLKIRIFTNPNWPILVRFGSIDERHTTRYCTFHMNVGVALEYVDSPDMAGHSDFHPALCWLAAALLRMQAQPVYGDSKQLWFRYDTIE